MMTKFIKLNCVLLIILLSFTLNACIPFPIGPGIQDYYLELPGAYELRRTSPDVIFIQYKERDLICVGTNGAIRHFAFNDRYIFFETEVMAETGDVVLETLYSAVDYTNNVYFEEKSYIDLAATLDTEIIPFKQWFSTRLSDIDWTDPEVASAHLEKGYWVK